MSSTDSQEKRVDMGLTVEHAEHDNGQIPQDIKPIHSSQPVWAEREPYGKSGFAGLFTNKYVFFCAAFSTLGGALFGYDQGVMAITLGMEQFQEVFPEVRTTAAGAGLQKGLLTAMIELGAFIGAMNQGWIADKLSRKWSIMAAVVVFLIDSAIQTGSMNYSTLLGGRSVGGIGVGMLAMVAPLHFRARTSRDPRYAVGAPRALDRHCYSHLLLHHIRHEIYRWGLVLEIALSHPNVSRSGSRGRRPLSPLLAALARLQGRDDEALQVLAKLRGFPVTDHRVLREWIEIRAEDRYCKESSLEKHPKLHDGRMSSRVKLYVVGYLDCFRKGAIKRTHVGIGLMFFQQFVGINALIYYSPTLFETMGLDTQMQLDMSGVLNICQVIACLWSLWGMDRFGRRSLLLAGGVCMVIAHLIIAVLVSLYSDSWGSHQAAVWTSDAFLLFFMLTFGATWSPIPWAMPAEIFPASLRAKGVAYSTMSNWLNNFIIGLITPPLIQNTGYGTYVFFCVFCVLALVWVWFVVPETNGRTLEQMDEVFQDNTGEIEIARRSRIETELAGELARRPETTVA
ncbi:RNA binding protein, heterogenous nuclear RNP-K like protein [Pestalotiopsis sp. IQ-011]